MHSTTLRCECVFSNAKISFFALFWFLVFFVGALFRRRGGCLGWLEEGDGESK